MDLGSNTRSWAKSKTSSSVRSCAKSIERIRAVVLGLGLGGSAKSCDKKTARVRIRNSARNGDTVARSWTKRLLGSG